MKVCVFLLSLCIRLAYSFIKLKEGDGCEDKKYFKCANGDCVDGRYNKVCGGLPGCEDESDLKMCGNPDGYDSNHNVTYGCHKLWGYAQCPVQKNSRLTTLDCWSPDEHSCKYTLHIRVRLTSMNFDYT